MSLKWWAILSRSLPTFCSATLLQSCTPDSSPPIVCTSTSTSPLMQALQLSFLFPSNRTCCFCHPHHELSGSQRLWQRSKRGKHSWLCDWVCLVHTYSLFWSGHHQEHNEKAWGVKGGIIKRTLPVRSSQWSVHPWAQKADKVGLGSLYYQSFPESFCPDLQLGRWWQHVHVCGLRKRKDYHIWLLHRSACASYSWSESTHSPFSHPSGSLCHSL